MSTPTIAQTPTPRAAMPSSPALTALAHGAPQQQNHHGQGHVHFGSTPPHALGGPPPSWASPSAMHSRQNSQASLLGPSSTPASTSGSPIRTRRNQLQSQGQGHAHGQAQGHVHATLPESSSTSTMADQSALKSVESAIAAAQAMFQIIQEHSEELGAAQTAATAGQGLQELLTRAKVITQRLKSKVDTILAGDASHTAALRDDHHVFVKVCAMIIS
jgi:hypothetical protein